MSEQTSTTSDRAREHPEARFHAPQHQFDLAEVTARLRAEPLAAQRNHRQETLYHHGPLTVALFLFEQGARLPQHAARGTVTVHVLDGRLKMMVDGQPHELNAGQLLVMAAGVQHDLLADAPTRMLLTICLE